MLLHLWMGAHPIVRTVSFRHALDLMRHAGYACTRAAPSGPLNWSCFAAGLGL